MTANDSNFVNEKQSKYNKWLYHMFTKCEKNNSTKTIASKTISTINTINRKESKIKKQLWN